MRIHSVPVTVRIADPDYATLAKRAERKGMTVREYIKWVLLRPHTKKEENNGHN